MTLELFPQSRNYVERIERLAEGGDIERARDLERLYSDVLASEIASCSADDINDPDCDARSVIENLNCRVDNVLAPFEESEVTRSLEVAC